MTLVIVLLGSCALAGLTALSILYATFGVGLFLTGFLFEAVVDASVPVTSLGPIQLYFTDIAIVAVGAATVLRFVYLAGRSRIPAAVIVLLVFAVVFAASFVRGVIDFGPQAAGVELRRYLGFLTASVYLITFRPTPARLRAFLWMFLGSSFLLCGLALYRWGLAVVSGEAGRLRVIDARATLVLSQTLLLCIYLVLVRGASRVLRASAAVLLPFIVLLQHRTVWVILIVALVIIAAREGRLRARLAGLLAFGAVAVSVGSLLLYGEESTEVLGESASQGNTFVWRLLGWRGLLQEHLVDPVLTLFGEPFGAGFSRFIPELGYTVNVTPHNFYVTVLLRGGIVALLCFVIVYIFALSSTYRAGKLALESYFGYRAAFILLASQLVYYLAYDPHHEQGIVFGIAMSLAVAWAAERRRAWAREGSPPQSPDLDVRAVSVGLAAGDGLGRAKLGHHHVRDPHRERDARQ